MRDGNVHSKRTSRLRDVLNGKKIDAFLTTAKENIFYLCGFTGSDGVLYVNGDESILFTDARYVLQCGMEVSGAQVVIYRKKSDVFDRLKRINGCSTIGYNPVNVSLFFYNILKKNLSGMKLRDCGSVVEELRQIKDDHEIRIIKEGIKRAEQSLDEVLAEIREGDSELDIKNSLESRLRMNGCEREAFETIVVSGANSALIHGRPGKRKIRKGDLLLIDYGARYKNYCTDETRTVVIGEPKSRQRKIYDIVKEAQRLAISEIRDGVSSKRIDCAARDYIKKNGYGDYFQHGLGHGVGLEVHEMPAVTQSEDYVLKEGMVVTIEPGIYIENYGGIRIEDMVYVKKNGCRILTREEKQLKTITRRE